MFFKNEAFALEKECRFVFRRDKDTVVHFREKDGFLIPCIEVPLSGHLLPLTEVMAAPTPFGIYHQSSQYYFSIKSLSETADVENDTFHDENGTEAIADTAARPDVSARPVQ